MEAVIRSETPIYDTVIIGGGLSGLTAAWHLREKEILVLESEDRIGGRLYSLQRDGYWLNLGAGVFSSGKSQVRDLVEELGLKTIFIPGSTTAMAFQKKILSSGRIETYPLRLPLSLSARKSLLLAGIRIRKAVYKYHKIAKPRSGESARDTEKRLAKFEGDRSFFDFLGKMHPDVDEIMRATAANRIGAELETISANAALGSFAYQWDGKKSILNHNLVGGSARLTNELAERIGRPILRSARVLRVTPDEDGVEVEYSIGTEKYRVRAKTAIVTTPADVTKEIVDSLPVKLSQALGEVRYGPAVLASVLTCESTVMPYDNIYAMVTPKGSTTVFINVANSLRNSTKREPGGSILAYLGGERARALLNSSDAEIEEALLKGIYELFPTLRVNVKEVLIKRWPRIVPYGQPGRHLLQDDLEIPMPRIFLAGDYLGSWANMEVAVSSAIEAAKKVSLIV
jgi:oxygen-dependent protoporphyrinogen oxidase